MKIYDRSNISDRPSGWIQENPHSSLGEDAIDCCSLATPSGDRSSLQPTSTKLMEWILPPAEHPSSWSDRLLPYLQELIEQTYKLSASDRRQSRWGIPGFRYQ